MLRCSDFVKVADPDVHNLLSSQAICVFFVLRKRVRSAIVTTTPKFASYRIMREAQTKKPASSGTNQGTEILSFPEAYQRLTAEQALRAAIDTQVFAVLRDLESLDGGRAVQAVYVALLRRIPNVTPDRKRIAVDCGFSESSVKRAIGLLERCKLISVERQKGRGSTYQISDLRASEAATVSLSMIRKLAKEAGGNRSMKGRATSEPTNRLCRLSSEPASRVTK
jgi:hypothetical protein